MPKNVEKKSLTRAQKIAAAKTKAVPTETPEVSNVVTISRPLSTTERHRSLIDLVYKTMQNQPPAAKVAGNILPKVRDAFCNHRTCADRLTLGHLLVDLISLCVRAVQDETVELIEDEFSGADCALEDTCLSRRIEALYRGAHKSTYRRDRVHHRKAA